MGEFECTKDGLFYVDTGEESGTTRTWISSPIAVLGRTHDDDGQWGRLLRWLDPKKQEVDYVMPMRLQAEKTELFKELLNRGLEISPARAARENLYYYLCVSDPKEIIRRVSRVGWFRDDSGQGFYVLPDQVFGRESKVHYAGNRKRIQGVGHHRRMAGSHRKAGARQFPFDVLDLRGFCRRSVRAAGRAQRRLSSLGR
jgi:hypothetical protein